MTKKIILHIGIHKTGTSSIQSFLTRNQKKLEAQEIFYPQLRHEWNNHNPLAWHLMDPKYIPPNSQYYKEYGSEKHWEVLFEAIEINACDTVLLSGEDFSLVRNPAQLAELLKDFDTRIIVYLRRQDQFLQSIYNQDVKDYAWMRGEGFDEFLTNHRLNDLIHYDRFLSRWAASFSKEKLSVGVYEKSRKNPGLIADFADKAGIRQDVSFDFQNGLENSSLSPFDLELKRILNGVGLSYSENELLVDAMRVCRKTRLTQSEFVEHRVLHPSKRNALMEVFDEGNRKVAKEYLKDESLLFPPIELNADSESNHPKSNSPLEMDVAPLVLELLRRVSVPHQQHAEPLSNRTPGTLPPNLISSDVPFSKAALTETSARLFQLPESAQDSENLYSMSNWATVFLPLLEKIQPMRIVEIGSELGGNTAILERFCINNEVELHSVDTVLHSKTETANNGMIYRHQARSVDFLADFEGAEVYFIDGDHNYHSVLAELELIERAHRRNSPLLVILDDTGWPCAVRDSYYDPIAVEPRACPISLDKGPLPWRSDLLETGIGSGFFGWLDKEGGAENGVRTAIEDFVSTRTGWNRAYFTPFYGICFLWLESSFSKEQQQYISDMILCLDRIEPIFATLEWNRVLLYLKIQHIGMTWNHQQDIIRELEAQNKYAGELWQKQQDWIQHLEKQLKDK